MCLITQRRKVLDLQRRFSADRVVNIFCHLKCNVFTCFLKNEGITNPRSFYNCYCICEGERNREDNLKAEIEKKMMARTYPIREAERLADALSGFVTDVVYFDLIFFCN